MQKFSLSSLSPICLALTLPTKVTTVLGFFDIIPEFFYYCLITSRDSDFPLFHTIGSIFI